MTQFPNLQPEEIIRLLDLRPHPEGGYFRETFRDAPLGSSQRAASTLIYFLLVAGQVSKWHRVDAAEVWHYYAGAPLQLTLAKEEGPAAMHLLGTDFLAGERPQCVVPAGWWQMAVSLGQDLGINTASWTLVGCTVAPGFEFAGFELAPDGWSPGAKAC
jgi:predicted cupin superfamily sugar epimerase